MNSISPSLISHFQLESFQDLDSALDRSESSIYSNDKCFSIKDIFPDDISVISEPKHQRVCSQQTDLLSPQVLFSHVRKPSKHLLHERVSSGLNEELNSTRMPTCQSRRVSDYDLGLNPLVLHEEQIEETIKGENYCQNCLKNVNVLEKFNEDSKIEAIALQIASYFFVCWSPQWLQNKKIRVCEGCGLMMQ